MGLTPYQLCRQICTKYHPENRHVIPALTRRFHEANVGGFSKATIWGSGAQMSELLHVADIADSCIF